MLKKAGIVVATVAAGLLAVSPLAFAGNAGSSGGKSAGGVTQNNSEQSNSTSELHQGLVNVSDNNINVPIQACGNLNNVDVLRILSNIAVGVLAPASTGNAATVTCGDNSGSAGDATVLSNQGGGGK